MSTETPTGAAAAVNAFLLAYLEDEEAGHPATLVEYQRRYPGFDEAIAREYAKLAGARTVVDDPDSESTTAVERFHATWREDVAAARVRPLAEYIRRFPGAELAIAEAYASVTTGMSAGHALGSTPGVGEPFGHYRIETELGRGGQGAVYLARDERTDRRVALKVLTGRALGSPEALLRFQREATVGSRIDHPGVCTVYESDAVDGVPYVAMRFVEGETLARRIVSMKRRKAKGEGPPGRDETFELVGILEQAAHALHAAHERGVLHRDLNPNNLMIEPDGRPVILDFGLAGELDGEASALTRTGDVFGTPSYMAPEQVSNAGRPDRRTDVWALGVTLFESVTLHRPFEGPTRDQLYRQILDDPPPDPRRGNPNVSADLAVVIQTALAKQPNARYHSADLLALDLAAVRESRPITARPPSFATRFLRWVRREPLVASLVATLALVAALASGLAGYVLASRPELEAGAAELERAKLEGVIAEVTEAPRESGPAPRRVLTEYLERDPANTLARAALVISTLAERRDDEALRLLRAAPDRSPDPEALLRLEVFARRRLGDDTNADDLAARIPDASDSDVESFVEGLLLLRFAKDAGRAREPLIRAVTSARRPQLAYHLACLQAAMTPDAAGGTDRETMERAAGGLVRIWPDSALALARAGAAIAQLDPDQGIETLQRALELDPNRAVALSGLSKLLQRRGHDERAAAVFRRLMEVAHEDSVPRHLTERFVELQASNALGRTVDEAREALARDPTSEVAHRFLVQSLRALGRHAEVADEATRRIELGGEPTLELVELRAEARRASGDMDGALADVEWLLGRLDAAGEPDPERRERLAKIADELRERIASRPEPSEPKEAANDDSPPPAGTEGR